jgi:hypothetical protein
MIDYEFLKSRGDRKEMSSIWADHYYSFHVQYMSDTLDIKTEQHVGCGLSLAGLRSLYECTEKAFVQFSCKPRRILGEKTLHTVDQSSWLA